MRRLPAAVLGIFALAGTQVWAADLAVRAPLPAPLPFSDWSGVYVGLEGGYGWGKQNTDTISPGDPFTGTIIDGDTGVTYQYPSLSFPSFTLPSLKQTGWLGGGFFGAQKQWGNLVLGIEGDIDAANIKGSRALDATFSTANSIFITAPAQAPVQLFCTTPSCFTLNHSLSISSKIDALASLRGKVGWSYSPNWLIYGTGGAAFAHVESAIGSTESGVIAPNLLVGCTLNNNICSFSPTSFRSFTSGGSALFGWALGGGVDWKLPLDAGSALVLGVEYLHYGFPQQTLTLSDSTGGTRSFLASENVDTIKGRISFLFSIH